MKKIFIFTLLAIVSAAQAQVIENKNTVTNPQAIEYYYMYSPKAKEHAIGYSIDMNKFLNMEFGLMSNLKFGDKEINTALGYLGIGVQRRYLFGESFMLNFHLTPYIGWAQISVPKHTSTDISGNMYYSSDSESEFTYGATGDINAAFKLFESKKGNTYFLNFGYRVFAGEFKTDKIFKNGFFKIGITTLL